MAESKIVQVIFNKFPNNMTVKSDSSIARLKWIGKKISSPENRLIMGVTAIASQPWIDLYNKNVDEDTRKVSCARTAAKIIAGTVVGVCVRAGSIALIRRMSRVPNVGETLKPLSKFLTPSQAEVKKIQSGSDIAKEKLKQYQNTVGTILGTLIGAYTNFAVDVPITKYLTNVFTKKLYEDQDDKSENLKGGK